MTIDRVATHVATYKRMGTGPFQVWKENHNVVWMNGVWDTYLLRFVSTMNLKWSGIHGSRR